MTVNDFLRKTVNSYQSHGVSGLKYSAEEFGQGALVRAGVFANYGIDFLEEDWDLLLVLDACRYDLMKAVEDEYDFIENVDRKISNASHSREWIHKTLMEEDPNSFLERLRTKVGIARNPDDNDYIGQRYTTKAHPDLAYITWNHFSRLLDEDQFYLLDEVWHYAWDDNRRTLEPRPMTDRTIAVGRERDPGRIITHYMQPHTPFLERIRHREKEYSAPDDRPISEVFKGGDIDNGMDGEGDGMSEFTMLQQGLVEYEDLWDMYLENLRWVLDDIEILLDNIDAEKVVITADHGNALGEFGCYGHRPYTPIDGVKAVPWVVTSATDEGTHEPEFERTDDTVESETVQNRLEDLGYI